MQEKSAALCSIPARLERLRVTTQATWAVVATRLGLSESMVYQVKSGKRTMSPKALYRLAVAETDAGLVTPLVERLGKSEDEMAFLREILDSGDWGADEDAQFAAMMGQGLLGQSVVTGWSVLEDFLEAFFVKVQKSADDPNKLRKYVAEEIPALRNQLKVFGFELERFVERTTKEDGDDPTP